MAFELEQGKEGRRRFLPFLLPPERPLGLRSSFPLLVQLQRSQPGERGWLKKSFLRRDKQTTAGDISTTIQQKSKQFNTSFLPAPQALLRRWLMYCLKETKVPRHSLQSTGSAILACWRDAVGSEAGDGMRAGGKKQPFMHTANLVRGGGSMGRRSNF